MKGSILLEVVYIFCIYTGNMSNNYGIELFTLCGGAATGYVLKCDVYTSTLDNKNNTGPGPVYLKSARAIAYIYTTFYTSPFQILFGKRKLYMLPLLWKTEKAYWPSSNHNKLKKLTFILPFMYMQVKNYKQCIQFVN